MNRLLIIDDEVDITECIADYLEDALEDDGFEGEVLMANTVEDAISILDGGGISFVLSDVRMPGGGGYKVAEHIKNTGKDAVLYFITGYSDIDQNQIKDLPVKQILNKPVDLRMIAEIVVEELKSLGNY